jgi:hypothetical protein
MRLGPVLLIVLVACSSPTPTSAPAPAPAVVTPVRSAANVKDDSNINRADYIGPDACGECHAVQHSMWKGSLHRVMNARADEAGAVIAPVTGTPIPYKDGELRMSRDLTGLWLTATRAAHSVRYRVTRTIGKGHLQEYVGIEDGHDTEVRLPIGYWPRAGGFAMQPEFDPWLGDESFDPFAPVREPWAERCPWCHSTYPFAQRIARASGPRAVGHGLEQFFVGDAHEGADRLDVAAQVTTGISCESCHLGGRAHAQGAPIQFLPKGATQRPGAPAMPTTFAAQRTDATVINTVCAQCHSGPSPRLADGTALRNSSEALDLAASSCTGIKCTDCHDPHVADGMPDGKRAVATCVKCHATQSAPQHAGTGHATASCLDCHMPRVVMGVDRYVRTHRISSPTDPRILATAGPNACNLCHLDRPISWTLAELRGGWDVNLSPARDAYGSDEASVGDVWLSSKSPAVRLIAAHAYARSPLARYALADIRKGLDDRLPYVRMWTRFAVEAIMGTPP